VAPVTSGAAGVDDVTRVHRLGIADHRPHEGGDLLDRLPLHAEPDGERGDLRVGRVAVEDLAQRRGRLCAGQILATHEPPQDGRPPAELSERHVRHRRSVPPDVTIEDTARDEP
jgi:hypothetical protein